jgi:hypothetical protein
MQDILSVDEANYVIFDVSLSQLRTYILNGTNCV